MEFQFSNWQSRSIFGCKYFLDFLDLTTCGMEKCTTITVTVVVTPDLVTYMHTCSSPPNSNHSESEEASRATGAANSDLTTNVIWTQEDKTALIDFLITHKSEAGNGVNFKPSVWTAAAIHMQPVTTKGGLNHADECKAKWGRVHTQ